MKLIVRFFFIFLLTQFFNLSAGLDMDKVPERIWLKNEYLPNLSGKVLFVGVDFYNADYYQFVKQPELFETIDCLSEQARFGSPYKHYTADFMSFNPGYQYDHICLFGVMGHSAHASRPGYYNIITDQENNAVILHAHKLLKVGGTLQLGPNKQVVSSYDVNYWLSKFSQSPLDGYEVIFNSFGPYNMLYWARKIKD